MPLNTVNLDDFPDSPYAAELRRRSSRLRFPEPLEAEFVTEHLANVRRRVRTWTACAVAVTAYFTVHNLVAHGAASAAFLSHLILVLPATAALAWLAWSGRMASYRRAARVLVPAFGAAVSAVVAQSVTLGSLEQLSTLTLLLLAAFFFMGLLFRSAMLTGAAIVVTFPVAAVAVGMPWPLLGKSLLFLLTAGGIGVAICLEWERASRKRFLEENLLNELIDGDPLTGLKNRRALDEHVLRIWKQCQRGGKALAFIVADIDYFKAYNDRYGHQAGDRTLARVAAVVGEFARRPLDIAARYGGEEFIVVIYDAGKLAIDDLAERLRRAVEDLRIENAGSRCNPYVTLSIGIGLVRPTMGRTPTGAFQLADEALYRAKATGRNRWVIAGQEDYESLVTGSYRRPERAGNGG